MLHPGKLGSHLAHGFFGDIVPNGGDSGQEIFHVMLSRQLQGLGAKQTGLAVIVGVPDNAGIIHPCAPLNSGEAGELFNTAPHQLIKAIGDEIVGVENGFAEAILMEEDVLFGLNIFLHIFMDVQMIGRDVGDHCHVRALAHGDQLEAGQLRHHKVLRLHLFNIRQQRPADVSAQMNGFSRFLEHFGNEGGGGGFAVAAGDADGGGGTEVKEYLHLTGNDGTGPAGGLELRGMEIHTGGAENDIPAQAAQIFGTQLHGDAQGFKLIPDSPQLFPGAAVVDHHGDPLLMEHTDQVGVADADADDGDLFCFQTVKKDRCFGRGLQAHKQTLPFPVCRMAGDCGDINNQKVRTVPIIRSAA